MTIQYAYQGSGYLNDTGSGQYGGFGSIFGVYIAEVGGAIPVPGATAKPWRRVLLDQEEDDNLVDALMFHPHVGGSPPTPVATAMAFRRFRFSEEVEPEEVSFLLQSTRRASVNPPSRRFIRPYLSVNI